MIPTNSIRETRLLSHLVPDPSNARKHSKKNLDVIKGSLKRFGQQKPIVVTDDGIVVAGNGTLEAARELGWNEIWVSITDLKGSDRIAFAIADNRTAEIAEWEMDILGKTLAALKEENFDLGEIGFDDKDLANFLKPQKFEGQCDEDEVPEHVETKTKLGDLYQLGEHRLLCGDSTDHESVRKLVGTDEIELCFTSPPYADQREYRGEKELTVSKITKFIEASFWCVRYFAVNLGISRKEGEINQYWDDYIKEAKSVGLKLLSWNVWDQLNAGSASKHQAMFSLEHEWVFIFGNKPKDINKTIECKLAGKKQSGTRQREKDGITTARADYIVSDKKKLGTVIRMDYERTNKDLEHPAKFPVLFPEMYIEACTNINQSVYDAFLGSGSTLIACEKTGRKCYGMEIDPHYCDIIVARWEKYTGKKAILNTGI